MSEHAHPARWQARLLLWAARATLLIWLVLQCAACGGTEAEPLRRQLRYEQTTSGMLGRLWEALPPLPRDKAGAATNAELTLDGNDWSSRDPSGYTADDGTFLNFAPPAGELAWGLYSYYLGSHDATGIEVTLQPGGQGIYVAYSDYAAGRWSFSGPYTVPAEPDPPAAITIPLAEAAISPLGNLYVVLAVYGSPAGAVLEEVSLDVANWQDGQMHLAAQNAWPLALAEIAGRPAVAYVEEGGVLKFIRAAVPDGSTWEAPVTVAAGPFGTLWSVSLAEIAGRPAIAVHRPVAGGRLEFIRALDTAGSNWLHPTQTVDFSAADFYCGISPSLAAINSYTAIAYRGEDNTLGYALNNKDASDPWFTLTLDEAGNEVFVCTLRSVNGHPAICYLANGVGIGAADQLQFAYSTSLSGINSLDWEIATIDETSNAFGTGWLYFEPINDSFPAVIYRSNSDFRIKYAHATTATGLDGWINQVIGPSEDCTGVGLVLDNGLPAVFYRDGTNTGFMRALDGSGTTWANPVSIAPLSSGPSAVAVINHQPAIAYTANTDPSILAYTYRP